MRRESSSKFLTFVVIGSQRGDELCGWRSQNGLLHNTRGATGFIWIQKSREILKISGDTLSYNQVFCGVVARHCCPARPGQHLITRRMHYSSYESTEFSDGIFCHFEAIDQVSRSRASLWCFGSTLLPPHRITCADDHESRTTLRCPGCSQTVSKLSLQHSAPNDMFCETSFGMRGCFVKADSLCCQVSASNTSTPTR